MVDDVISNIAGDLRKLADSLEKMPKKMAAQSDETKISTKEVTLEMIRAKLAALMQAGKQAEVKGLLKKHGGEKLSDVPKENYQALLRDAEGI